ncbi:hypothetical protein JCM6882_006255 [Rhodosporidiobolus microsporus]
MLDRLPDSVLHAILSQNLPPLLPRLVARRYKSLLRYCRISRSCARVAQQLLYKHLDFAYAGAAVEFCQAVDDSPSARRVAFNCTRSLRITPPPDEDVEECRMRQRDIENVLRRIPGVREIWLEGVPVDVLSLSIAADLRRLRLHRVFLYHKPQSAVAATTDGLFPPDPPETWHLPRLESLSLTLPYFVNPKLEAQDISLLLRPLALPSLRALAFTWHPQTSPPHFGLLAAQLSHLWLKRRPFPARRRNSQEQDQQAADPIEPLPLRELAACSSNLLHLAVDIHRTDDFEALSALGSEAILPTASAADTESDVFLRTLRLESPFHTSAEGALLDVDPPCLATLRALLLPDISDLPEDIVVEQGFARQTTREECKKRGIRVAEREFEEPELTGAEQEREEVRWRGWCQEVDLEKELEDEEEREKAELQEEGGGEEEDAEEEEDSDTDDNSSLIVEAVAPVTSPTEF